MKLKKFEICAIAVTVILASFGCGYFIGQGREPHIVKVEPVYHEQEADRSVVIETDTASADDAPYTDTEGLININKADRETLCTLDGIGEVLAGRIIEYREAIGGFTDKEELMDVYGLGEKIYEKIKDTVTT